MSKTTQQPQKNAASKISTAQPQEQEKVLRKAQTPTVNPQQITPAQVPYLQRTIGNRAVSQLLNQQGAGQIQRAPQADIQRNYPHGATAGPLAKNDEGLKAAIEQAQQSPQNAIQRAPEEEEAEGES